VNKGAGGAGTSMENRVSAFAPVLEGAGRFFAWWRGELWDLVPERGRKWLAGAGPGVVLAEVETGFQIIEEGATRPGAAAGSVPLSRAEALSALAKMADSGKAASVAIRLPQSKCFQRKVELPRAARREARQILNFNLERATPFKLRDVYTAHVIEDEAGSKGKLRFLQLVAKREAVDPLVADVKAAGLAVASVDCWHNEPSSGLPVNFLEASRASQGRRSVTLPRVLAALVLLLIGSAFLLLLTRHGSALAELQARTAKMRTQAAEVRRVLERSDAAVAGLARLHQLKLGQVPSIEVLEELSRVLPDSAWLSDLRIEGDTLDISGLAKSGAALPSLLEKSPLFADAALTAPLTLDPREDRERFSLRVRIKRPVAARQASAGGG
jgi:general secretion pathway protein L